MMIPKQLFSVVTSVFVVLLGQSAFAQPEQHSYFIGTIGADTVQVELIVDNGSVRGSFYDATGAQRTLEGGLGNRAELSAVVLGADETELATLSGVLEPSRFEGEYTPNAADTPLTVQWQKVADYAYLRFNQDLLETTTVFPHFTAEARILNEDWQPRILDDHLSFVREGQDYLRDSEFPNGYFLDSNYDIVYYASDLVSVLETVSFYTGGAHPNFFYDTYNVGIGQDTVSFTLGDVLSDGGLAFMSTYILDDLREQEAPYVVDGSITSLSDDDLSAFVVSPAGVRIYFAPYAVGPYVAGAFEVLVAWEGLEPYIPANSPLARFL